MSRRIANPKLAALLKASQMALHDLAAIAGVNPRSLLRYSRGQSLPILERKLARVLQVSIPELRCLLGLEPFARRKRHAAIAFDSRLFDEVRATLSAYNEYKAIYRWANGRGRYVNGGARFAAHLEFKLQIAIAQSVPRSIVVLTRSGKIAVLRLQGIRRRASA